LGRNGAALSLKTRYTYLGDSTIEVVVSDDEIQVNVLPPDGQFLPQLETSVVTSIPETLQTNSDLLMEAAPSRVKPAASSGIKAGLASFGGMIAAGLVYVQENFGSLSDVSLKNVALIGAGAIVSGLLYFLYRWYKPANP
jgi:hypothetical protein